MIVDVPSSEDFRNSGIAYLNLAWEAVLDEGVDVDPKRLAHPPGPEDEVDDMKADWDAVNLKYTRIHDRALAPMIRRRLAVAITLLQQGTEFLLKAKIAAVSPLLLIAGGVREWPKGCDKSDIPFAAFRTLDAQDLPRLHDAVTSARLSDTFRQSYDAARMLRNTIVHTVDKKLSKTAKDVLVSLLETTEALIAPQGWLPVRKQYLNQYPDPRFTYNSLITEMNNVINALSPADAQRFFGLKRGLRRYRCYRCHTACDGDWAIEFDEDKGLAQLEHRGPEATQIHCLTCGESYKVLRKPCTAADCRGSVIDPEDNVCLTCLSEQ